MNEERAKRSLYVLLLFEEMLLESSILINAILKI